MKNVLIILANFVLGAIPWAVIVGHMFRGDDITRYGDHNPGTYNALRAGGVKLAAPALVLEVGKGFVAGSLAKALVAAVPETPAWVWVAAVVAPIAGHGFSPFLGFWGGKSLAVTFGVWAAIAPLPVALSYAGMLCLQELTWRRAADALKVGLAMLVMGNFIWITGLPRTYVLAWALNLAILIFKQWQYETLFVNSEVRYAPGLNDEMPRRRARRA